ncbi:hypothetical protein [Rhodoplanes sp. SY1]|uniref:hypothetical protein n=1 Tax=Rhodoplanes sp. SY1 TaxID=3166646 RepID=UPI0038B5D398
MVGRSDASLQGRAVVRHREGVHDAVIPGRAEGANPESSGKHDSLGWIPGSALRAAPE